MPYLEIISSPANLKTNRFPLKEGANVLGREAGCDIEIPDPRISSKHAIIMVQGQNVEIIDQNSTNGIYLDEQRVRKGKWTDGSSVFMGNTEMRLKAGAAVDNSPKTGTSQWGQKETALGARALEGRPKSLNNSNFDFNIVEEKKIGLAAADASQDSFAKRMAIINKMIKSIGSVHSVPELLDRTMTLLFEAVNCDTGYILVTNPANHDAISDHLAYEHGVRKENLEEKLYSRTLVSTVIQKKSGFIFDSDESGEQDQSLSIFQLRIKTALCCPIHSEGQVYGVLYLDNKKRGAKFNGDDLDLAMNIAGISGVVIENLQLSKKLETESLIRDHLKRFCSPNIAEKIIAERGSSDFHLQSQKTTVTVLFADIRGFTPLSESLAPLAVAQLLNNYFSEMCAIVFANGGTLDKFIGDCMMVLFNAPMPVADHEYFAVKTALQMRNRLQQKLPEWKAAGIPEFQVGIGVNTGDVVVGSIGTSSRMEYTAIGDTVNISSRVCGIARPNQVLITDSILEKVKGRFRTVSLGAVQLKGKSRQVFVHEVVDDLVMPKR
jgi:adenylate cyclase